MEWRKRLKWIFVKILFLIFFIKLICYFSFLPFNNRLKKEKAFQTKEFQIELKNLNVSFYFFGNGQNGCKNKPNILIATQSTPKTYNLRMGIRNSWQKDIQLNSNFTHKFFIGLTWNETLRKSLEEESQKYGDIIFTNIVDDYSNLTLKMNSIFQWQQIFCPNVDSILRADEDTVLDVSRFEYWMNNEIKDLIEDINDEMILGHLIKNSPTVRQSRSKWYVPHDVWKYPFFPNYMSGASYLITSKAVKTILKEVKKHKFISIDDAFYTGIVAEAAGIPRIDLKQHFWKGNPLLNGWNRKCGGPGIPLLFSISDEVGEIEITSRGYSKELKKLKNLNCSFLSWDFCFTLVFLFLFFSFLRRCYKNSL